MREMSKWKSHVIKFEKNLLILQIVWNLLNLIYQGLGVLIDHLEQELRIQVVKNRQG